MSDLLEGMKPISPEREAELDGVAARARAVGKVLHKPKARAKQKEGEYLGVPRELRPVPLKQVADDLGWSLQTLKQALWQHSIPTVSCSPTGKQGLLEADLKMLLRACRRTPEERVSQVPVGVRAR